MNFAVPTGADDIVMFGRYYQTIVAVEPDMVDDRRLLSPEEASFIRRTAAYDDLTAAVACRERLDLGLDYYYAVKHQITSFMRVWDAVLDEKRRYDAVGWLERSRGFMDSFQLCSYLIPQRVSIGFLGPYGGIPQLDTSFNDIPALSRSGSYPFEGSTAVNSPVHWAEYEKLTRDSEHDEGFLSDEEYPEALALSPTESTESFENAEEDGGAEIISLSGGEDDSASEYSDDSYESDESEGLQFPLEIGDENVPNRGFVEPNPYRSKDLNDASWERLLSSLPDTQQPPEEARHDASVDKRPSVPRVGKPLSLELEDVPKKRKLAVHGSNGHDEGTARGGKRPRGY